MRNFCAYLFALSLIFCDVKSAPREKRWIPERYSDHDYGMDNPSGDHSGGTPQNFLSYFWPEYFQHSTDSHGSGGEYSGLYYRAGGGGDYPGHVMTDPVQMLHSVQTHAYAQGLRQQYPQIFSYGPPPPRPNPADMYHDGVEGRASLGNVLGLNLLSQQTHPQTQIFVAGQNQPNQVAFATRPQAFVVDSSPQTHFSFPVTFTKSQLQSIQPNQHMILMVPATSSNQFGVQSSHPLAEIRLLDHATGQQMVLERPQTLNGFAAPQTNPLIIADIANSNVQPSNVFLEPQNGFVASQTNPLLEVDIASLNPQPSKLSFAQPQSQVEDVVVISSSNPNINDKQSSNQREIQRLLQVELKKEQSMTPLQKLLFEAHQEELLSHSIQSSDKNVEEKETIVTIEEAQPQKEGLAPEEAMTEARIEAMLAQFSAVEESQPLTSEQDQLLEAIILEDQKQQMEHQRVLEKQPQIEEKEIKVIVETETDQENLSGINQRAGVEDREEEKERRLIMEEREREKLREEERERERQREKEELNREQEKALKEAERESNLKKEQNMEKFDAEELIAELDAVGRSYSDPNPPEGGNYEAPEGNNYEDTTYSSPLDLVYPGVMTPVQNQPPPPSPYYPPPPPYYPPPPPPYGMPAYPPPYPSAPMPYYMPPYPGYDMVHRYGRSSLTTPTPVIEYNNVGVPSSPPRVVVGHQPAATPVVMHPTHVQQPHPTPVYG